jgi:hypothetical protein
VSHREGVDTAATVAAFKAAAEAAGPVGLALARPVWNRLDTDRWTLEWQLPLWLGDAFGLDRELARRLVTSNVLGLASLRLADDLADGEIQPVDMQAAQQLSQLFHDAAVAPYRELFDAGHPLWARLGRWMADSTRETGLESRGAPLKIPAFAVCALTCREAEFPTVERCLDHALRAMVLYDHARDWREDLAAGRWNAFTNGERDARRVEAALLAGDVVGPYFARIDRELERAHALAVELEVFELAAHLSSLRSSIDAEGRALESRHDALGTAAARLVFGQHAITGGPA